jgi:hypothetical protein
MAVTITPQGPPVAQANKKVAHVKVAFDNSYPTGGEPFTAGECGLSAVERVRVLSGVKGYQVDPDVANMKLIVRRGDNANAAAAPAVEVANAVDLTTLSAVELEVVGY